MGRSREGFFGRAREKGSRRDRSGIDGAQVHKDLEDGTKRRYKDSYRLWLAYCAEYEKDPDSDAYDLETLKDFAQEVGHGMNGIEGKHEKPSLKSVRQVWKDFTAEFRRSHDPIPRNTTLSVTNFINTVLRKKLGLPLYKRQRRYGTSNHLLRLGTQMWENDWYPYPKPGIRVSTWSEILDYAFTSARVGEYLESSARPGSSRGLYYRDIIFAVFRNEDGKAEFAAQLARDAKSTTWTPDKRQASPPEHAIHEGSEPRPFLLNPILPKLAMCIARGSFRDYTTMEELLAIPPPPEKEMYELHWKPRVLNKPFYERKGGEIEKANLFATRLSALCRRTGYPRPPTVHDFRAEGLHIIDQLYSTAQRMKHGGHRSEGTHRDHYQPNNPGTDGQDAYLGGQLRTIVADLFRGMTVPYNPNLLQSLPAEKKYEIETSPEFVALERQLQDLKTEPPSKERERRRRNLHTERHKLKSTELRKAQESQPYKHLPTDAEEIQSIGGHRARFARFCRLTPERQRLAKSMFAVGWLRSPEGRSVLQDMIALYQQETEVAFHPGLEAEKCHCPGAGRGGKPDKWRHIYECHKKHLAQKCGSAELCFLCDEWILGSLEWEAHCQAHLGSPQTLPVQCDPLIYCGTLATAGYCPRCLGDPALSASERMNQILDREAWKAHVTKCVQVLDNSSVAGCALPWCTKSWEGVLKRRFHLQDVHCVEFTKDTKRDRPDAAVEDKEVPTATYRGKRRRVNQAGPNTADALLPTMGHHFIDETAEIIQSQAFSLIPQEPRVEQRRIQRATSDPNPAILDDVSPSPYPSTSTVDNWSPFTPFTDVGTESFESLLDPDLLCSMNSTSRSSSPAASQDITTAQGDEEDGTELPSLHSLLALDSTRPPSDSENALKQKSLAESTLQIQGWVEVQGPDGTPVLQELPDYEPETRALRTGDTREGQWLGMASAQHEPVPVSDLQTLKRRSKSSQSTKKQSKRLPSSKKPSKRPQSTKKQSERLPFSKKLSKIPQSIKKPSKRLQPLKKPSKRSNSQKEAELCRARELEDAKTEWTQRGYPTICWRRLNSRLRGFSSALRDVLGGIVPSFYRTELESAVAKKVRHKYRCMENATAGYYGPRGQQILLEHILAEFGPELRRRSNSDGLLRTTGVSDFVITVLVPELAVMLVKEDMNVCDKTARQVLQESASLGEMLHEDI